MSRLLGPKPSALSGVDCCKGEPINEWDEALLVAAGATATIVSYTVPVGKKLYLDMTDWTGETIASYRTIVAGFTVAYRNMHWGAGVSDRSLFNGLVVTAGQTVKLDVFNFRSAPCDFFGRIVGRLDDV